MVRLTRRDEYNELECIVESVECNGYCEGCDVHTIIKRLAEYEDEAYQREKGWSLCTEEPEGFKYGVRYRDGIPYIENEYIIILSGLSYCPVCGRKLVDKTND